jgi:hypothetical protein
MDQYFGEWVPYSGNGAIFLGVVLLIVAGVFTFFGFKLKTTSPSKNTWQGNGRNVFGFFHLGISKLFICLHGRISPYECGG